jgi:hypothetical protein
VEILDCTLDCTLSCTAAMLLLLQNLLLPRKRAAGCSAVLLKYLLHLLTVGVCSAAMLLLLKKLLLPRKRATLDCSVYPIFSSNKQAPSL